MNKEKKLELPFRIVKRSSLPLWKAILVRVIAALAAIVLCSILAIFMIGADPISFISSLFKGTFGSTGMFWIFLKDAAKLLCIALAITPAFKMKFWNIGAEGQTLIGALAATAVVYYTTSYGGENGDQSIMAPALQIILMLLAALLAGAVWGGVPALFKAIWGTNETLFTLMMNYVAEGITLFFVSKWAGEQTSLAAFKNSGHLPVIGDNDYLLMILLVLLLTGGIYVYQRFTKQGYEISVVGESENTANYIGINVKKVIIRTMLISGAICGFAGFLIVGALDHTVNAESTVGGLGFTAIMVSWLAKFNPLTMIGTASFITFLDKGAGQIITDFSNVQSSFPDIIIGIFLFFIIGCEFFINYQLKLKSTDKAKPSAEPDAEASTEEEKEDGGEAEANGITEDEGGSEK